MTLRFHNTLTRRLEDFAPLEPGKVRLYSCGPTVYSYAHIGNFRHNLMVDLLRRYLTYRGFHVTHVMNITDVGHLTQDDIDAGEDKMQAAARCENRTIWDVAKQYTEAFLRDVDRLGIWRAHHYPRATDHVPEMIAQIETLIAKGHAYVVNGSVYYDVTTFPAYGSLSNNRIDDLEAGARIDVNPEKRHPADFALWKRDEAHLMQWDSPWGRGFPGWHIECSAMSMKYLGSQLDIHTGGEDNIFPHHECEIAQAEGVTAMPFVRLWLHCRHLLVDGRKMSKSLGNFYTLQDLLDKGFSARAFRYLLVTTAYHQNLNFTLDSLKAAESALQTIDDFIFSMERAAGQWNAVKPALDAAEKRVVESLDDNLNASAAISVLFDLMKEINRQGPSAAAGQQVLDALRRWDVIFGCFRVDRDPVVLDDADMALIRERDEARRARQWKRGDEIRDHFKAKGIVLLDSPGGTLWKRQV